MCVCLNFINQINFCEGFMEQYIPLGVLAVFALFILVGMFWGMVRGLKKTAFRAGWIVVVAIILLFLTPVITKAVMDIKLPFLAVTVDGVTYDTLRLLAEYGIMQIPDMGELIVSNPDTLNILITLVTLFINSFVFVLLFWATKIVLYPVWGIVNGIVIKKKDKNGNKLPKYRLFGLLVGAVLGAFVCATTLMPVLSIVNMANKIENETYGTYTRPVVNEETGLKEYKEFEGGEITKLNVGPVMTYLKAYDDSAVSKILKYTGIEAYTNFTYDILSSAKVGGTNIKLRNEVKNILITVGDVTDILNMNLDTISQESMRGLITAAKDAVNHAFSINTITGLGDSLFETVLTDVVENPNSVIKIPSTGEALFDEAIKAGVVGLKNFRFSTLKNELLSVLNIAEIANEKNILTKLMNNEVSGTQMIALFDTDTVEDITDEIFNMNTMSTLLPIVVNTGLDYVANIVSAEGFEINEEQATAEQVKTLFKAMLTGVINISNSLDLESKYYITDNTLPLVGKLLDAIKAYGGLDTTNYNILLNAAETKLYNTASKALENFNEDMNGIKEAVLGSINNLSTVTNFETEFTKINSVFETVTSILDSVKDGENVKPKEVGKVLDTFKTTQIFGNRIEPIMQGVLDFAKTVVPVEFADLTVVLERVKLQISNVQAWETELDKFTGVIDVAQDIFAASDLKTALTSDNSTLLVDFGRELDKLESSILFGAEIKNVVKILIDTVGDFTAGNEDMLTSSVNQIKTNIDNSTDICWETEFGVIRSLIKAVLDLGEADLTSTQVASIGATLDEIVEEESVLVDRVAINKMVEAAVDQFAGEEEPGTDMYEIIQTIKTTITTTPGISYEQELGCLFEFLEDLSMVEEEFDFIEFGRILDSYDEEDGTKPSVCVTAVRARIVRMIVSELDTSNMDDDMVTIVDKIKNNCDNIENYEAEFTTLDDFMDTVEGLKSVDVEAFNFAGFGAKLDSYATSKLIGPIRSDVLKFIVDKVEISSTEPDIQTAINNILQNAKDCAAKADAGTMTYTAIFTDLGKLKDLTDSFANVEVDRNNPDAIVAVGGKLNELGSLCIVPEKEVARIAKFVTGKMVGPDSGVQSMIPEEHRTNTVVQTAYNSAVSVITELNEKYTDCVDGTITTTINYIEDFTVIKEHIIEIDGILDTIEGAGH